MASTVEYLKLVRARRERANSGPSIVELKKEVARAMQGGMDRPFDAVPDFEVACLRRVGCSTLWWHPSATEDADQARPGEDSEPLASRDAKSKN
mmetsp:Transcript_82615/g.229224  ORF Transcript_82615/g.229224 Transcript_82615/m.229224 type:complete len:94 (-) Transcript_82615:59-340(-)